MIGTLHMLLTRYAPPKGRGAYMLDTDSVPVTGGRSGPRTADGPRTSPSAQRRTGQSAGYEPDYPPPVDRPPGIGRTVRPEIDFGLFPCWTRIWFPIFAGLDGKRLGKDPDLPPYK